MDNSASAPNSILITLMGSLGDVTRGLTLVSPLKKAFPAAQITWLVEPKCADLVGLHSGIDKVVLFDRGKGISGILALWRQLSKLQFDLCLDLQRHFKSGLFSRFSGARRIIGFHRADSKEGNWLFSHEQIPHFGNELPKIEHYWKFLEYLKIEVPTDPGADLKVEDKAYLEHKFSLDTSNPYLVMVLGSSWESKDWPISGYQRVLKDLAQEYPKLSFVLTGGKEHFASAEALQNFFKDQQKGYPIHNLCAKTSLSELCALVKFAKVVVGPDSGPGHLASLFNVPFVGLFGPTDAGRTAPYGTKVSILSARIGCRPCYQRRCPGLDKLCMRLIDPKLVVENLKYSL